jgi:putative ABC transport system permease protein
MIKNYFKTAWRNLWKNKIFSLVNILGLSLGMASTILLLSYIAFQDSYDNFHSKKKDIYRVALEFHQNGKLVFQSAENYSGLAPALKKDLPEVIYAPRLYNMGYKNNCVFSYDFNKNLKETKFLFADPSFFNIFSFPFIQGDSLTSLSQPNTAVISESTSRKMFGNHNAIGKFIQLDDDDRNSELCRITGVFKDIPENSHLKFNILFSYSTLYHRQGGVPRFENTWDQKDFYTYVLLRAGTDPKSFEKKLSSFVGKHITGEKANHSQSKMVLQPLLKIHLGSHLDDEAEANGNEKVVFFLMIMVLFIITIAWVNYINLTTAGSVNRAKEIGIRKVLGSQRPQLIKQFITESIGMNLISLVIALAIANLCRPLLQSFFQTDFPLSGFLRDRNGLIFVFFLCFGAFFSGLYPAFILSSFKPALVLKGKMSTSRKGLFLRRSLVIFQFSLSIFLIIGTLTVYQQVNFMLKQNLGMKVSQVLVMDRPGHWDKDDKVNSERVRHFKEALKNGQGIESVAMSDGIPGKEIRSHLNYRKNGLADENPVSFETVQIDEDYLNVLGMNILAGRNFSKNYKTDENSLIITESAARFLGYLQPGYAIGKQMVHNNINFPIIGVIGDFHQQSLEKKVEPIVFQFAGNDYEADEYYLVKVKTSNLPTAINQIQDEWSSVFKGNPFSYFFLDDYFNQQYKNELQFGMLFGFFSLIAIVIACIGLFALVAFMINQRTKEIGVRKVLGASLQHVMILLTKDFIQLILLANIISWPLGWFLMNNWLSDFAYRISISWWIFGLSGLTAVFIALATISFQAFKAATANPVKTLRSD